jgi:hypothetical protein
MRGKNLLALSLLASWVALVPFASLAGEGHLLLISESHASRSSYKQACFFYSLDLKTSSIAEVQRFQFEEAQPILRVDADPSRRQVLVWVDNPASHTVEAHILSVDGLDETDHITFPASGILPRCYHFDETTSTPLLAVESWSGDPAQRKIHVASRGAARQIAERRELSDADGRHILLSGDASVRAVASNGIPLSYNATARKLVAGSLARVQLEFPVDEKTAELIEKQPKRPAMGVVCNDSRASLIAWGVPLGQKTGGRFYLFDKEDSSWKLLIAKGDASNAQMFKNWISIQEENWRGGGVFRMTGEFEFYNRDDATSFTWRATSNDDLAQRAEILAMWEKDFVYRLGTQIYHADIGNGKVANERLIFESKGVYHFQIDPIEQIHWAFRLPE